MSQRFAVVKSIVLLLLLSATFSYAGEEEALFEKANALYREGEYGQALELYKEILANDYRAPELYYNIGNTHFKLNQIPNAILYYERAARLAPNDEEIEFNLKIANLQTIDKIEPVPTLFLNEWWQAVRELLSADNWAVCTVALVWLAFCSFGLFVLLYTPGMRKLCFSLGIVLLAACCFSGVMAMQSYNAISEHKAAIIFSPSVYVKSAPDDSGTDLFILHEGTKVELFETVGNWRKIRVADGNYGWVLVDAFQEI